MSKVIQSIADLKLTVVTAKAEKIEPPGWLTALAATTGMTIVACGLILTMFGISVCFHGWDRAASGMGTIIGNLFLALLASLAAFIWGNYQVDKRNTERILPTLTPEECLAHARKLLGDLQSAELLAYQEEVTRIELIASRHRRALELATKHLTDPLTASTGEVQAKLTAAKARLDEAEAELAAANAALAAATADVDRRVTYQLEVIELALLTGDLEQPVLQLPPPERVRIVDTSGITMDAIAHASGESDDPAEALEHLITGAQTSGAIR